MFRIIIDVMGSDNGPAVLVDGAVKALGRNEDMALTLVGDEKAIREELSKLEYDKDRLEVIGTEDVITNYDTPTEAIFKKTGSSLVVALKTLAKSEDAIGMINAGNTGALLAGSLRYVPAKPLKRPALAAILPAEAGGYTCLVDTGANVDCISSQLVAFAHMGSDFMKRYYSIESPRVGLLSNGAEETKGNRLVKETHALLKAEEGLNFIGNVEGNRALSGDCDVLVADGFAGNQVFKSAEGIAKRIITDVVKYAKKSGNPEMMKLVAHLLGIYDFSALGGGIILGAGKPIIKARGSATADSITNTSEMLLNMAKNKQIYEGKE